MLLRGCEGVVSARTHCGRGFGRRIGSIPGKTTPSAEFNSVGQKSTRQPMILSLLGKQPLDHRKSLERTNIVFPRNSSILFKSRYSASTILAGHSYPPHSETSVWSLRGGLRRFLIFRVTICDCCSVLEGKRFSEM